MKLFPKYVPSYEEDRRDKTDRARRIGIDLFAFAILWSIVCIGILCGGTGRYDYEFYPHMRRFDVIASCIGLGWSAILTLYYFLMKPATRKKLVAMHVLDGATFCLLLAYSMIGTYVAQSGRFPDSPVTFGNLMVGTTPALLYLVYFVLFDLIYYRKSKIELVDHPRPTKAQGGIDRMKTLKQTLALILAVFCLLTATACGARSGSVFADNNTIADETFGQILQAIEENDASRIVSLFSPAAQSEQENIHEEAEKLIDFIKGDTVSHTSAEKSGVGARIKKDNGKTHKNIQACFTLETTEGTYYIAIKECVQDEFDGNNVGVMSFYIIEEKNWDKDYVYRAGGATETDLGIHIELEAREPATD